MSFDDVPPDEMFRSSAAPDPIDAALRGEPVDDPALATLVTDLRAAYLSDEPRPRSAAVAAFAGPLAGAAEAGDTAPTAVAPAEVRPARHRVLVGFAAFAATLTGKVVLAGAVAAATLGGLHAADVVDVPLLPAVPRSPAAPATVPDPADPVELPATGEGPATPAEPAQVDPPASDAADGAPPADRPAAEPAPAEVPSADPPAAEGTPPGDRGAPDDPGVAGDSSPGVDRPSDVPADPPVDGDRPAPAHPVGDAGADDRAEPASDGARAGFATKP